jgi:hypothetical protein
VPADGFWSLTVYNTEGYLQPNQHKRLIGEQHHREKKSPDGWVAIQLGGCDGKIQNCLPITPGWNYTVRLFRPRAEILYGTWSFSVGSARGLKPVPALHACIPTSRA